MQEITFSKTLDGLGWLTFYSGIFGFLSFFPVTIISFQSTGSESFALRFIPILGIALCFFCAFIGYRFIQRAKWSRYGLIALFVIAIIFLIFSTYNFLSIDVATGFDAEVDNSMLFMKYSLIAIYVIFTSMVAFAIALLFTKKCKAEF